MGIEVAKVHPSLRDHVVWIDRMIESPKGLLKASGALHAALAEQRDFLASREQALAHDVVGGGALLSSLMLTEWNEFAGEVRGALARGEKVDGRASAEAADYIIFASHLEALLLRSGASGAVRRRVEILMGLGGLGLAEQLFPGLNGVEKLAEKVRINEQNWPERILHAPPNWSVEQIAGYHVGTVRPALKALRREAAPETRILPMPVTVALNEARETPPDVVGATEAYSRAYLAVLATLPVGV